MRTPIFIYVAPLAAGLALLACNKEGGAPAAEPKPTTAAATAATAPNPEGPNPGPNTAGPNTEGPNTTGRTTEAPPREGEAAPALVAIAASGAKVDLAAMKGKHVVVYFYPKDDTPGCTKEACAFRDAWSRLEKGGVTVIGVSHDDDASHRAFAEKYKLPFPLVADTDGAIARRFGVPVREGGYYARVSYLIGPDGKVKKIYPKVDPAVHADEILADARVSST